MHRQEESQEVVFITPAEVNASACKWLSDDAALFRQGYGLGYLPEGFHELSAKEKVKASFATLAGQHFSVQDLKLFLHLGDDELPENLSRDDIKFMIQKRLEWQADVIQLLLQDTPAPSA